MDNPYLQAGPDARKAAYLVALSHSGLYYEAAEEAGIAPSTADGWRRKDPLFLQACREALEHATERFEAEAIRRGVRGIDEPVIHQGRLQYEMEPVLDDEGQPVLGADGEPQLRLVTDETGRPVRLTIKKYSDALLGKVLEANVAKYARLNKVEVTGSGGGPVVVEESPLAAARKIAFALAVGLREKQRLDLLGGPGVPGREQLSYLRRLLSNWSHNPLLSFVLPPAEGPRSPCGRWGGSLQHMTNPSPS